MPKDNDFLIAYYNDCRSEMRWRSEIEHKLFAAMIALCTVLGTVLVASNNVITDSRLLLFTITFLLLLLLLSTYFVTKKITSEHRVYENIGQNVTKIWEYFKMFEPGAYEKNSALLESDLKQLGKGTGYKETIAILWIMTIVTSVLATIYTLSQVNR